MVGTSILQLLSSATTAVEKYLNKFLSFELHLYTMHWVVCTKTIPQIHQCGVLFWSFFKPKPSVSFGLSLFVFVLAFLNKSDIHSLCKRTHLMALTINYLRPPSPPINITISLLPHKCTVGHTPVFGAKPFSTLLDK